MEKAIAKVKDQKVTVTIGQINITFEMADVGGCIELSGRRTKFADKIAVEQTKLPGR